MMEAKTCRIGSEVMIGYSLENDARQIRFDLTQWLSVWPQSLPTLLVVRPGETAVYPAQTEMDGQMMVWTVKRHDTEIVGMGEAWVVFRGENDEMLGLTPHSNILIRQGPPNIEGDIPPESVMPWVESVLDAADRAEEAAKRAEEIAEALAGGGSGGDIDSGLFLPSVKEEDNGKVLTVVDGKWAAADPPESGVQFETDDTLMLEDGTLRVNTADKVEEDNTLPVTSAAVYTEVGNINALLATI